MLHIYIYDISRLRVKLWSQIRLIKKITDFLSLATPLAVREFNSETEDVVFLCRRNKDFFSPVNIMSANLVANTRI